MLADGKHNDLLDICYQRLIEYQQDRDIVIINGWRSGGFAFNAQMASHLDAPAILVLDYLDNESATSAYDRAMAEVQEYRALRADVMAVMVNRVPDGKYDAIHAKLQKRFQDAGVGYLGTMPQLPAMQDIRLDQIYEQLDGRLLFGSLDQVQMDTPVKQFLVGSSQCGTMLSQLRTMDRPLLISTPDRIDVITTCIAAHSAGAAPLAGIVLTDHDGTPSPYRSLLRSIFEGLERQAPTQGRQYRLPIFLTNQTTYDAVRKIDQIDPAILPTSLAKIDIAQAAFEEYVDIPVLERGLGSYVDRLTPTKFLHGIRAKCKADPQRIVLPESSDHRILVAAATAASKGLARVTLLGDEATVLQEASKLGLDMSGVAIVNPATSSLLEHYADELVEARRKKGLSRDAAYDLLKDENYFGTMMVRCSDMDGLVSGAAHTTAATVRPAMQVLKDPGMPLISSVFFMCLPDKVLVYGDCAVNVDPSSEQLAYIAVASAETAAAFGIEPRIAMLSYSTLGSGSGPQVEKVTEAVRLAKEMRPDLKLTGPIQYDAATNERIAAVKVKAGSDVAGKATVLVFPDLNTGNNTYKAVQQASGAVAMGPLMQGLARPVNDLSRGCTVADILDTICATSLQAQFKKAVGVEPVS